MAHALTFTSEFHVLVNNSVVSSPYTLQNGDVITIQVSSNLCGNYRFSATYGETTAILTADNPNLSVSDSDISLTAVNQGGGH